MLTPQPLTVPTYFRQLCTELHSKQSAYVLWRLPNRSDIWLAGGEPFYPDPQIRLENLPPGFVLCPFAHRPSQKAFIRADILLSHTPHQRQTDAAKASSASQTRGGGGTIHALPKFLSISSASQTRGGGRFPYYTFAQHRSHLPDFEQMVADAVTAIRCGQFEKVVLSRYRDVPFERVFDPFLEFGRLVDRYPTAFVSLVVHPGFGTWIGATPETLVERDSEGLFRTVSLAGTQQAKAETRENDVLWSQKEIEEQAMVSRYIINCFKKIRLREYAEVGPRTVRAGNLLHLRTDYEVNTHAVNYPNLASDMLDLLHPTSAVCGMPKPAATRFIEEREGYDRGLYSGFFGPVNIQKHTHLFVNLRCAKVMKGHVRLFAGCGITADSDPAKELAETNMKMATLSGVLLKQL